MINNARHSLQFGPNNGSGSSTQTVEGTERVEATVIPPAVGVYHTEGTSTSNKHSRPFPTSRPEVSVNGDLMVVK